MDSSLTSRSACRPSSDKLRISFDDLAIAWIDFVSTHNFANFVGNNHSGTRILDRQNFPVDLRVDVRILECKITIDELAIFQLQVFAVTERLSTDYHAIPQRQPVRIPSEILALDRRILDKRVFRVPERVFRSDCRILNVNILRVLERIFASILQIVYI